MPGTMFSLCTSVGSSFSRLAIVLRTRSKEGRGLSRITCTIGIIIPKLFVSKRT
jgi:hypothetical protein